MTGTYSIPLRANRSIVSTFSFKISTGRNEQCRQVLNLTLGKLKISIDLYYYFLGESDYFVKVPTLMLTTDKCTFGNNTTSEFITQQNEYFQIVTIADYAEWMRSKLVAYRLQLLIAMLISAISFTWDYYICLPHRYQKPN